MAIPTRHVKVEKRHYYKAMKGMNLNQPICTGQMVKLN